MLLVGGICIRITEKTTWDGYDESEKLAASGVKSFEIFMRPPLIKRTFGLTSDEWREISARLDNPEEWHPERVKLHNHIMKTMFAKIDALSQRLRQCEIDEGRGATIYCLRGACGSGKTTALRKGIFRGLLDENGKPSGVLAPDVLKTPLRGDSYLNHTQVHDESSMLNRKLSRVVMKKAMQGPYSMVYDRSMAYPTDFEDVFNDALETNRKVVILDFDIPLELSAVRVLSRVKNGEDPNINFSGVADAFLAVRKNRAILFSQISEHSDVVSEYELRVFAPGERRLIDAVRFEKGEIRTIIGREKLVEQAAMLAEVELVTEIARVQNTVINEDYIAYFKKNYCDNEIEQNAKNIAALRENKNKTIGEALDAKSQ